MSNLDLDRVKWVLNNINFCRVKDALEIPLLDEETVKKLSKVDDKQNSWIMM